MSQKRIYLEAVGALRSQVYEVEQTVVRLSTENTRLKARIARLETDNARLKDRISDLPGVESGFVRDADNLYSPRAISIIPPEPSIASGSRDLVTLEVATISKDSAATSTTTAALSLKPGPVDDNLPAHKSGRAISQADKSNGKDINPPTTKVVTTQGQAVAYGPVRRRGHVRKPGQLDDPLIRNVIPHYEDLEQSRKLKDIKRQLQGQGDLKDETELA
ncbi:uncharacterized protein K460DRAFT_410937 [Cucurbitaria berberidis CBS 394.84]|uniref:Uncharacterized protein n=1 Tax=Cucurbitaria berberidis CBS 394.84 TaxID=1168544 RepID=A0A9P4G796_9PLEO|nr:uncharacterized protein K460DRAFT_410937 [Cucurbitaria berberidis CBS 394.84]KAF1840346.1 hypothetical protein K460DRAFT_410937 [Cucurbitaria berberidis CBS 394.84]